MGYQGMALPGSGSLSLALLHTLVLEDAYT